MKAMIILLIVAFMVSGQSTTVKKEVEIEPNPIIDTLALRLESDQININRAKVDYSKSIQEVNTAIDSLAKSDK